MTSTFAPAVEGFLPLSPVARTGGTSSAFLRWRDRDAAVRLWSTIDELTDEFGDRYSDARIIGVAIGALRDLQGSSGVDALPELISRLVRVRLLDAIPSGSSAR